MSFHVISCHFGLDKLHQITSKQQTTGSSLKIRTHYKSIRLLRLYHVELNRLVQKKQLQQPIQEFLPLGHRYLFVDRTSRIEATREQIDLASSGNLGSLHNFPNHVGDNVNCNANVGGNERSSVPVSAEEDAEAGEDGDDTTADGADVGSEGLKTTLHGKGVAVDVLGFAGVVVADVADAEGHPGEETGDGAEIEQPGEGLGSTT
jgi:hypothetical protein